MNLQRREEIRVMMNRLESTEWVEAGEYKEAMSELLAHIDTLEQTAAERVIARGAVVKPHTFGEIINQVRDIANQYAGTGQLRERIVYALAPHFERDAGPTPDYTGEGSAWAPPVEAWALVAPDDDRPSREFLENYVEGFDPGERSAALFGWREGRRHLREHSRAIPADRLPGEGMVAVTWIPVDEALPEDGQTVGFVTECANDKWYHGRVLGGRYMAGEFGGFSVPGLMVQASHWFAFPPLPDALRANQGGAAA